MSVGTAGAILIGGGVAAAGGVAGSLIGASAADKAGQLQYQQAQQQLAFAQQAFQQQIQARASGIADAQKQAQMSPDEIKNISGMLTTQSSSLAASLANIKKMQGQLDAMDPQVKAAGSNLYSLLTGQSAAILAPLQQKQSYDRQNLVNQLSSQMGPGFMTSSAGIAALTQFDNQSAITLNQVQMQAVQTVGSQYLATAGMQQQGQYGLGQQGMNAYGQSIATQGAAAGAFASNTALKTNATLGAMNANQLNPFGVANAQGAVVGAAPGTQAGAATLGMGVGNLAGGVGSTIGNLGMMNMLQGMGTQSNQETFGNMIAGGNSPIGGAASVGMAAGTGQQFGMGGVNAGSGYFGANFKT